MWSTCFRLLCQCVSLFNLPQIVCFQEHAAAVRKRIAIRKIQACKLSEGLWPSRVYLQFAWFSLQISSRPESQWLTRFGCRGDDAASVCRQAMIPHRDETWILHTPRSVPLTCHVRLTSLIRGDDSVCVYTRVGGGCGGKGGQQVEGEQTL